MPPRPAGKKIAKQALRVKSASEAERFVARDRSAKGRGGGLSGTHKEDGSKPTTNHHRRNCDTTPAARSN